MVGYDAVVITFPSESRVDLRGANRHKTYLKPPCGVVEYVGRGVRDGRNYIDADQLSAVPVMVLEYARKIQKIYSEVAWVARWRH